MIGVDLELRDFDLSLDTPPQDATTEVVLDAADALRERGFGLKAATVTPEDASDVGSPNALLRERVGGRVILRTGQRIPGVAGIAGVQRADQHRAHGGRRRLQRQGVARGPATTTRSRTAPSRSRRATCRAVAEFAFSARGAHPGARCSAAPSSPWLADRTRACSRRSSTPRPSATPSVHYEPQLIDATYALLLSRAGRVAGDPGSEPRRRHASATSCCRSSGPSPARNRRCSPSTTPARLDSRDDRGAPRHRPRARRARMWPTPWR